VPRDLAVRADAAQLRQLLWNLVLNAAQAMPEGGTLALRARAVDERGPQGAASEGRNEASEGHGSVEIAVVDTGVGIPPEVMDRIFDPFFTTKREGTGLGLATVHRIVEGNGGTLRVESAVGSGTAFQVRLPRAEGGA
jgi:signal transduction histidine kinase